MEYIVVFFMFIGLVSCEVTDSPQLLSFSKCPNKQCSRTCNVLTIIYAISDLREFETIFSMYLGAMTPAYSSSVSAMEDEMRVLERTPG